MKKETQKKRSLSPGALSVLRAMIEASDENGGDFGIMETARELCSPKMGAKKFAGHVSHLGWALEWTVDHSEDPGALGVNCVQFKLQDSIYSEFRPIIEDDNYTPITPGDQALLAEFNRRLDSVLGTGDEPPPEATVEEVAAVRELAEALTQAENAVDRARAVTRVRYTVLAHYNVDGWVDQVPGMLRRARQALGRAAESMEARERRKGEGKG